MDYYILTEAELNATATAIKNKFGKTDNIQWEENSGFANEINWSISNNINLVVTTPPEKTIYRLNESFDPSGMVVTANLMIDDKLFHFIINNNDLIITPLTITDYVTEITLSYTIDEITTITTQPINVIGSTLNNTPWESISNIAQAGLGDTYWDIGDCKKIVLNGRIGAGLTLSKFTTYVFILDFNHVDNGIADNNIIFGGFKTALNNGIDIALCDDKYLSSYTKGKYFNYNHYSNRINPDNGYAYGNTYGGWKGCDLRYDILGATETPPSPYNTSKTTSTAGVDATINAITNPISRTLMAALPEEFRQILRLRTHYTDNVGNRQNVADVSAVVDATTLLSEYEVFGEINASNPQEKYVQTQMQYYKNGNSKAKYKHNDTADYAIYLLTSTNYYDAPQYITFVAGEQSGMNPTCVYYAIAPVFKV